MKFKNRGVVIIILMFHWSTTKDGDESRNTFQPQPWDELNTKDSGRHGDSGGAFWGHTRPAQPWKPHTDRHTARNHQIRSQKAMSVRWEEPSVCHVECTELSINFTHLCMCMHPSAHTFDLKNWVWKANESAAAVQNKHQLERRFHLRLTFEAHFNEAQTEMFLHYSAWVTISPAWHNAKLTSARYVPQNTARNDMFFHNICTHALHVKHIWSIWLNFTVPGYVDNVVLKSLMGTEDMHVVTKWKGEKKKASSIGSGWNSFQENKSHRFWK